MDRYLKKIISLILTICLFVSQAFGLGGLPLLRVEAATRVTDASLAPVLYFTDLESAPVDAHVTVWGMWLEGAAVTVGGETAAAVYTPRVADNTFAGLDLDRLTVTIPNQLAAGKTEIKVTTLSGSASIGFEVRDTGRIINLASDGDLSAALSSAGPGDIIYLADGFAKTTPFTITTSGTAQLPIAIIAAPGAEATFTNSALTDVSTINGSGTTGIVLSQIKILDSVDSAIKAQNSNDWRIVGCDIAAPSLRMASGNRGGISGAGANMKILGNNIHNILGAATTQQPRDFSNIWLISDGSDIEIAYNFVGQHDGEISAVGYGILESGTGVRTNLNIHHNYMYNIFGAAVRMTNSTGPLGDVRFVSNVFHTIGTMEASRVVGSTNVSTGHYAIMYLGAAMSSVEIVNNTFYNCGPTNSNASNYNTGAVTIQCDYTGSDILIANNIIFNKNCRPGGFGATGQRPFTLNASPEPGNYGNIIFAPNQSVMRDSFAAWDKSGSYISWNNSYENPANFTLDENFFIAPKNGDLRPADNSQAIDKGEYLLGTPGNAAADFSMMGADGVPRGYKNSKVDTGAFEAPSSDNAIITAGGYTQYSFTKMYTGILTVSFKAASAGNATFGVGGLAPASSSDDLTALIDAGGIQAGQQIDVTIDMVNGTCAYTVDGSGGGSGSFNTGKSAYICSFYLIGAGFELTDISITAARINSMSLFVTDAANIPRGETKPLTVTADIEGKGPTDVTSAATFMTTNSKVATADMAGVTGIGRGEATITATYMGSSATQAVTVVDPTLESITFDKVTYYTNDVSTFDDYKVLGNYTDGTRFPLSADDGLSITGIGTTALCAVVGPLSAEASVVDIGTPSSVSVTVNGSSNGAALLSGGTYDVVVTASGTGYTNADVTKLLYPSGKYKAVSGETGLSVGSGTAYFTVTDVPVDESSAALFFTDLTHVPAGGFLTVWGDGMGTVRGSGYIKLGSSDIEDYYIWGYDPASSRQKITFKIPDGTAEGNYDLQLCLPDGETNTLTVTVTNAAVIFASDYGNDIRGDGSSDRPYETIAEAWKHVGSGGVVYVGTPGETSVANRDTAYRLSGAAIGSPCGVVAYPGAAVQLGGAAKMVFSNSQYVTISQFVFTDAGDNVLETSTGTRFIGNIVSHPSGDGANGTVHGSASDVKIMGNLFQNCGKAGSDKLFHVIYLGAPDSGISRNAEIGWNRLLDNKANRAIQFNNGDGYRAGISYNDIEIHDNLLRNNRGNAINLASCVGGYAYIYNNIIDYCGAGYDPGDSSGIYVPAGNNSVSAEIYNNLVYNSAAGAAISVPGSNPSGVSGRGNKIYNNIIVQSGSSQYINAGATAVAYGNLYFGSTAGVSYDTGAIVGNPAVTYPAVDYSGVNDVKVSDYTISDDSPAKGAAKLNETFARKAETDINGIKRGVYDSIGPWYLDADTAGGNQSGITPEEAVIDLYPGTTYHKPLEVTVNLNGNRLLEIRLGDSLLTSEQYSVAGDVYTFPVSLFNVGDETLTFTFSGGSPGVLFLTVMDSDPGEPEPESLAAKRPYIAFSDITSGPSAGGPGGNGAVVTIWGHNFSDNPSVKLGNRTKNIDAILSIPTLSLSGSQIAEGSSQVFKGVDSNNGLDYITFQIPKELANKMYNVWVETDGSVSNAILFTVRDGVIRYLANNSDPVDAASGSGTKESPFNSVSRWAGAGNSKNAITYIVGNFTQTRTSSLSVSSDISGSADSPTALIAYPGSNVLITSTATNQTLRIAGNASYITLSKLKITAANAFISVNALGNPTGLKAVGCEIAANTGATSGNVGAFTGLGENLKLLGNLVYKTGSASNARDVYVFLRSEAKTDVRSVELAFNKIGNFKNTTSAGNALWCFHDSSDGDKVVNLDIHDNLFYKTNGSLRISSSSSNNGTLTVYNNVFDQVAVVGGNGVNSALALDSGHGFADINITHNTFTDCTRSGGTVLDLNGGRAVIANNIFYNEARPATTIFSSAVSAVATGAGNVLVSSGNAPSWDSYALIYPASDPSVSAGWFTDLSGGNYTLSAIANHPAVGAAADIYAVYPVAYNGIRRPITGADSGACQSENTIIEDEALTASDLTFDLTSVIYNGLQQPVDVSAEIPGLGAITVKYDNDETPPRNAGTYTITVDVKAGGGFLETTDLLLGTYTIDPAVIEVTGFDVSNKDWDGGTNALVTVTGFTGVFDGDDVVVLATGEFVSADAGYGIEVGVFFTLAGTDSGNYILSNDSAAGAADICELPGPAPDFYITGVETGNKQANVNFSILSANGKGYAVYLSGSGLEGSFTKYDDVNYNSKGAHIKDLINGQQYYVYIEYNDGNGNIAKSDIRTFIVTK